MREAKERQEEAKAKSRRQDQELMGSLPERERRLFKEDGTPTQMNTAKWPFSIEEDALNVYVDIALPKFLESNMVRSPRSPLTHSLTSRGSQAEPCFRSSCVSDGR